MLPGRDLVARPGRQSGLDRPSWKPKRIYSEDQALHDLFVWGNPRMSSKHYTMVLWYCGSSSGHHPPLRSIEGKSFGPLLMGISRDLEGSWRRETDFSVSAGADATPGLGYVVHNVGTPTEDHPRPAIPLAPTHLGFICRERWFIFSFGSETNSPDISLHLWSFASNQQNNKVLAQRAGVARDSFSFLFYDYY
jgi:hypothetical protein